MRSIASVLAHVLATAAVVGCGGRVEGMDDPFASPSEPTGGARPGPTTAPSTGTPPTTPPRPPTPPVPTTPDGGVDAGPTCAEPPKLLRSNTDCSDVWLQPCGLPAGVDPEDGLSMEECRSLCGPRAEGPYWGCREYLLDDLPGPSFECYTCVAGRRPAGYGETLVDATVKGWLAHAADLERVSIDAFQILRRELAHHGAPPSLVTRARRAEEDEVRHARWLTILAEREHATVPEAPVVHGPPRALVDVAIENAVEGCVRETYGALVAGFQAEHAGRADLRRAMASIHRDETEHAELAWQVHAWAMERLSAADAARVEHAFAAAVEELVAAAESPVAQPLVAEVGLPRTEDARWLVAALRDALFGRASTAA